MNPTGGSLLASDRGGILVASIFAMAFLVGVVYLVVGAGTAMQHGELMQDGADAAAFSVAQLDATAMNLIAMLNMVKLSALAILIAPVAIFLGAKGAVDWINDSRWRKILYGWVKPFLAILMVLATVAYLRAVRRMPRLIGAADRAQRILAERVPELAERLVNAEIAAAFAPPVESFFLSPRRQLAVEPESRLEMCARVYPFAYGIMKEAFSDTIPSGKIRRVGRSRGAEWIPRYCLLFGTPGMRIATGARPGSEHFQVRVFATGQELSTLGERGVQIASWGTAAEGDELSELRDLVSRIGFAQAEYYFEGRTLEPNAMWQMRWRARLRRFQPGDDGSLTRDCLRAAGSRQTCEQLPTILRNLSWAIIH